MFEYSTARIIDRHRNHGGSGVWCPPMFSVCIIYDISLALAYRSIEPRFIEPFSYASDWLEGRCRGGGGAELDG